MSVAALPARPAAVLGRAHRAPRTVLVCVPQGTLARGFVERVVAEGGGHLVRVVTTPRQAFAAYARCPVDVVLVDRHFMRDPIEVLGTHRSLRTAIIVVDVGLDGGLMAAVAGAATGEPQARRSSIPPRPMRLTGREQQVLGRLCDGGTNEEIAAELGIGADTVKTHVRRLYDKLGARRRTQAVAMALRAGLVD